MQMSETWFRSKFYFIRNLLWATTWLKVSGLLEPQMANRTELLDWRNPTEPRNNKRDFNVVSRPTLSRNFSWLPAYVRLSLCTILRFNP